MAAVVPAVRTARLTLRAPHLADVPAYSRVFTSDRTIHIGGTITDVAVSDDFCAGSAVWMLRGPGMRTLTLQADDGPLGWVCLWQEHGDPLPEPGWVLTARAGGRGCASEPARAVPPHALALYGPQGFVSDVHVVNYRAVRAATALGAVSDPAAEAMIGDPTPHVLRHFGVTQ